MVSLHWPRPQPCALTVPLTSASLRGKKARPIRDCCLGKKHPDSSLTQDDQETIPTNTFWIKKRQSIFTQIHLSCNPLDRSIRTQGHADFIGLLHSHFHVRVPPCSLKSFALSPDVTVLVTKYSSHPIKSSQEIKEWEKALLAVGGKENTEVITKQCPPPVKKMRVLSKVSRQIHVGKRVNGQPIPRHVRFKPFAFEHMKLKAMPQQGKVLGSNTSGHDQLTSWRCKGYLAFLLFSDRIQQQPGPGTQ